MSNFAWFIPNYKADIVYPSFLALLPSILTCFFFIKLKSNLQKFAFKYFKNFSEKRSIKQCENVISYGEEKLSKHSKDLVIHTFIYFCGLILIETQPWSDDIISLIEIFPHQSFEIEQIIFYNIYFGYAFSQLFSLNDSNLKLSYLLHHVITAMILITGWAVNICGIGSLNAYKYKLTDALLSGARFAGSLGHKRTTMLMIFLYSISWVHIRLVWTFKLYYNLYWLHMPLADERSIFMYAFFVLHLLILAFQIYWSFPMGFGIIKMLEKKRIKDPY